MPTTTYNMLDYDREMQALYSSYMDGNMTREEYLAAHEARVKLEVERNADDLEALRIIGRHHIRCSREGMMVHDAKVAYAERHGLTLCSNCSNVLEGDSHVVIESGNGETLHFCDTACAHCSGWHQSAHDGAWLHEDGPEVVHAADGSWFADEDEARAEGYDQCHHCGGWYDFEHSYCEVRIDDELYCCEDCAQAEGYERCERCDEWHHEDDMRSVIVSRNGFIQRWCDWCANEYGQECWHCDEYVDDNVAVYDEEEDRHYCPSCARRYSPRGLHEYGFTPELKFRGDAKNSPYLGVELETDGGSDRGCYVDALDGIEGFSEHFYMTRDSSLENGVEITSHPCTLSYHANELASVYENIRSTALRYGFQSHNGGRCGLHVHMNREFFGKGIDSQDVGGYKMMRLLQRFEQNFTKFSRRRDNGWCRYATYNTYGPDEQGEPDDIRRVIEKAKDMKDETRHEQALNFQHDATYEFRIFRGTLNLSTFYACLGMVNGIAHVAKMHSAHYVETVEWSELMRDVVKACDEPKCREYLREYLEAKELL